MKLSRILLFLSWTFPDHVKNYLRASHSNFAAKELTQPAITCSKLTTETLEQGVKYVQS